jgi:hypothetical protein
MIRTVLITVLIFFIIGLFIFWLVTGGAQRAWNIGKFFTNPVAVILDNSSTTGTYITLPWQPESTRGPDISAYVDQADQQKASADSADANSPVTELAQYGNPSPYAGMVTIASNNASASDPAQEYVELQASSDNTGDVDVTGWSLQSAVSGLHASLPEAAPIFVGGTVNNVVPVHLAPSASAIVTTAASPIGVSFQETLCTGYLAQLQTFSPSLGDSCPTPSDALPQTAENLRAYGSACIDYVNNMPSCYFAGTSLPTTLSKACQNFISTNLSYNGCVAMYRSQQDFASPTWRLYLAMRRDFWNNSHDVIRLLDDKGRIVDVLSY